MKTLISGLFFTLFSCIAYSQDSLNILIDSTEAIEVPEGVKLAWKKHLTYRSRLLKEIKFGVDSTERYAVDKKSHDISFIEIHKKLARNKTEFIHFYYSDSHLVKVLINVRERSNLGIWQRKGYGVYLFLDNKLTNKVEKSITPNSENRLLFMSEKYFSNALAYSK